MPSKNKKFKRIARQNDTEGGGAGTESGEVEVDIAPAAEESLFLGSLGIADNKQRALSKNKNKNKKSIQLFVQLKN